MDFQQQAQSEAQTEQSPEPNRQIPEVPVQSPMPNQGNEPAPQQRNQRNAPLPQSGQDIGRENGRPPYQNQYPYGSNPNQYHYNNPNPNSYPNMDPYYNRSVYHLPSPEPGSSLANAAMVLGIIAIISCFTFTVYPPFILGSIAIVLALLSKGRRPKLFSKAKTGIICATIGLVANTIVVTSLMFLLFTDPDIKEEVNRTFKEQYGVTFDEVMEEIMEENGLSY